MKNLILFTLFIPFQLTIQAQEKLSIYFDFNASTLSVNEIEKIEKLGKKANYVVNKIVAYTDTFGSKNYNQNLAEKRLNSVLKIIELKSITIKEKQILGENYTDKNEAISNYKAWRRVDIFYYYGPINEPEAHYIEGKIEKLEKIIEPEIKNNGKKFAEILASETPKIVALDVKFYGGVDEFLPSSMPELYSFYTFLEENTSTKILIRGHVCCFDDHNLSVSRALAVYTYLAQKGIDRSRLTFKGFSNTLPVVFPEITDEDRTKNRRVDVEIVKD